MKKCNLPTHKQSLELIQEHHVPAHIVRHSLATAKLAVFLTERLKEKGYAVDAELVEQGFYAARFSQSVRLEKLDADKFEQNITGQAQNKWQHLQEDYKDTPHEYIAYELLKEKYPELALTIRKHRYISLLDEEEKPQTWEEKLVYYADKRIMHDKIVPLKQRLAEAHKRNIPQNASCAEHKMKTAKVDALIYELEKQIFENLEIEPDEITDVFIDSYK